LLFFLFNYSIIEPSMNWNESWLQKFISSFLACEYFHFISFVWQFSDEFVFIFIKIISTRLIQAWILLFQMNEEQRRMKNFNKSKSWKKTFMLLYKKVHFHPEIDFEYFTFADNILVLSRIVCSGQFGSYFILDTKMQVGLSLN
jgi:hypothetical protein